MKDIFNKLTKFPKLMLLLLFLAFGCLILGLKNFIQLSDLWINLSAGWISLIGTLFLIDVILDRRRKTDLKEAHDSAKADLTKLNNMMISYIAAPFGIIALNYEQRNEDEDIEIWSTRVLSQIISEMLKRDKLKLLSELNKKRWQYLQLNIMSIKMSLSEELSLYKDLIPSDVLGKLLSLKRSFSSFYFSFGLLYEGYLTDNKAVPKTLLEGLAEDLTKYLKDLELLTRLLRDWKAKD